MPNEIILLVQPLLPPEMKRLRRIIDKINRAAHFPLWVELHGQLEGSRRVAAFCVAVAGGPYRDIHAAIQQLRSRSGLNLHYKVRTCDPCDAHHIGPWGGQQSATFTSTGRRYVKQPDVVPKAAITADEPIMFDDEQPHAS